jgi:hypothetical protein
LRGAVLAIGQVLRSFEDNMLWPAVALLTENSLTAWSDVFDHIGEVNAREERSAEAGRTPRESERFGDDVLLLATVTGADEGDG